MLRLPPRASGGPLQAEFRVRGPRTSARKSVWRGSWASRDLGLQEFLEAQMDLEAQMEAQIHFLEAQLVFWRPMGLCTLSRGPNPSLAMEASVEQIFGGRLWRAVWRQRELAWRRA